MSEMREDGGAGPAVNGPHANGGDFGAKPPRKPRRVVRLLSYTAAVVVAAAGAGVGVTLGVYQSAGDATALPGAGAVPSPIPSLSADGTTAHVDEQQIVKKVEPGLVAINTTVKNSGEAAAGTGMVVNSGGLVLTNNHVIEGSTKITATVVETGKTYPATVIGYDQTADVALIKLQGVTGLRTVPVGDSASVKTGGSVVALGNAEGGGAIIPAAGQVTGLNQTITATDAGTAISTETLHGVIQVNARIVPGDSGGPLVTTAGQVIGMDTAGNSTSLTQQQPEGFAIPVDTALSIARQIAAGQASSSIAIGYPPSLGIFTGSGTSSSPQTQAQQQEQQSGFGDGAGGLGGYNSYTGSSTTPACYTSNTSLSVPTVIAPAGSGTLIDGTVCGGPAASAGMTAGSVITAIDGKTVTSPASLTSILAQFRPGDTISVTWLSPDALRVRPRDRAARERSTSTVHLTAGPPQ